MRFILLCRLSLYALKTVSELYSKRLQAECMIGATREDHNSHLLSRFWLFTEMTGLDLTSKKKQANSVRSTTCSRKIGSQIMLSMLTRISNI